MRTFFFAKEWNNLKKNSTPKCLPFVRQVSIATRTRRKGPLGPSLSQMQERRCMHELREMKNNIKGAR